MADLIDNHDLAKLEPRSWSQKISDFVEGLLDLPDDPEAFLIFAAVVVFILLVAAISAAFETWNNPPSHLGS